MMRFLWGKERPSSLVHDRWKVHGLWVDSRKRLVGKLGVSVCKISTPLAPSLFQKEP